MQSWGLTDPGCVRPQNQDTFQMEALDRHTMLCVVCDGMGGAKSGNIASTLALDVFVQEMKRNYHSGLDMGAVDQVLERAVKLSNFTVFDQARQIPEFSGMGTTLVAALIKGRHATVVNVGDSRCYRISAEGIAQVTTDHSLVQLMLDRGELTAEQARSFPGKNYITRAIGTETMVQCDVHHLDLERGDCLLLCSDGLTNMLEDQEILFEIVHGVSKKHCCKRLLDIAKSRGAPDNVTSILVQV
ncbi:MAG: Stp1/IreP family PP2C-type Ser/Thr phosphatase [Oscillospiraceae bacterium]|nr:Stp1/IreP family PP2C-type Ser/Thr phosphatase [Oscillospiraceae bacterium]